MIGRATGIRETGMYPSDFSEADAVYAPMEEQLLLGVPPLLALLLALLLIAVALGAYVLGKRAGGDGTGEAGNRAVEDIYAVILRYAAAARGASSNELKQKAEDLQRKIEQYLGAVILIGKDMGGPLKALKSAVDGTVEEPAKPAAGKDQPKTAVCGCGGQGTPHGCSCGGSSRGAPAHPVSINQIYIGGPPTPITSGPDCDHGPSRCDVPAKDVKADKPVEKPVPPPTVKRDMTGPEQTEALDKAVRAFNDYWLVRDKRVAELKEARRALNRRPTATEVRPTVGTSPFS